MSIEQKKTFQKTFEDGCHDWDEFIDQLKKSSRQWEKLLVYRFEGDKHPITIYNNKNRTSIAVEEENESIDESNFNQMNRNN